MTRFFLITSIVLIGFFGAQQLDAKTLKLNPNESKVLTNNTLWKLNANCNIQGVHNKGKVKIVVLKNNGTINGKNLSTGQATSVTVKNNSNISVSAESGTQINLINLSNQGLEAVCAI